MEDYFRSRVLANPLYFIAAGFGSGLMPFAPGTWGTLVALPIYWVLRVCTWPIYLAVVLGLFVFGVALTEWAGPARPGPENPEPGRPGRPAFLVVFMWESEEVFPFFL